MDIVGEYCNGSNKNKYDYLVKQFAWVNNNKKCDCIDKSPTHLIKHVNIDAYGRKIAYETDTLDMCPVGYFIWDRNTEQIKINENESTREHLYKQSVCEHINDLHKMTVIKRNQDGEIIQMSLRGRKVYIDMMASITNAKTRWLCVNNFVPL
tara:strand:+ start:98 stop:553 length:456 start_codon:yes stop_codon:yes gene_type:complete